MSKDQKPFTNDFKFVKKQLSSIDICVAEGEEGQHFVGYYENLKSNQVILMCDTDYRGIHNMFIKLFDHDRQHIELALEAMQKSLHRNCTPEQCNCTEEDKAFLDKLMKKLSDDILNNYTSHNKHFKSDKRIDKTTIDNTTLSIMDKIIDITEIANKASYKINSAHLVLFNNNNSDKAVASVGGSPFQVANIIFEAMKKNAMIAEVFVEASKRYMAR